MGCWPSHPSSYVLLPILRFAAGPSLLEQEYYWHIWQLRRLRNVSKQFRSLADELDMETAHVARRRPFAVLHDHRLRVFNVQGREGEDLGFLSMGTNRLTEMRFWDSPVTLAISDLGALRNLRRLVLDGMRLSPHWTAVLFPHLADLSIVRCSLTAQTLFSFITSATLPHLAHLALVLNICQTVGGVASVLTAEVLSSLSTFNELKLVQLDALSLLLSGSHALTHSTTPILVSLYLEHLIDFHGQPPLLPPTVLASLLPLSRHLQINAPDPYRQAWEAHNGIGLENLQNALGRLTSLYSQEAAAGRGPHTLLLPPSLYLSDRLDKDVCEVVDAALRCCKAQNVEVIKREAEGDKRDNVMAEEFLEVLWSRKQTAEASEGEGVYEADEE
ncbi:hypothetical protein JCM10213v2_003169 [Rhodosporidiobolus nylandii]